MIIEHHDSPPLLFVHIKIGNPVEVHLAPLSLYTSHKQEEEHHQKHFPIL